MNNDPARDNAMDKLVGAKLRSGLRPQGPECLDAETLAAYVERTLSARELTGCESHLANCSHCQEQVAMLVKLGEADEPVTPVVKAPAPTRAGGFNWFRWAWAGPALAAMLVMGIYFVGPFRENVRQLPRPTARPQPPVRSTPPASSSDEMRSQNSTSTSAAPVGGGPTKLVRKEKKSLDTGTHASAPAAMPAGSRTEPAGGGSAGGVLGPATPKAEAPKNEIAQPALLPSALPPPSPAKAARNNGPPATGGNIATPSERSALLKDDRGRSPGTGGAPVRTDEAEAVPVNGATKVPANQPVGGFSAHRRPALSTGPQALPAPSAQKTEAGKSELQKEAKAKQQTQPEEVSRDNLIANDKENTKPQGIVSLSAASQTVVGGSPGNAPGWRVGRHGRIQKLNADGKWKNQKSGVKSDLYASASPSPEVVWVGGESGTILRTTDGGLNWSRVPSPTTEDILSVTATSDQAATVVSRDGKTFTTADAGISWNPGQ